MMIGLVTVLYNSDNVLPDFFSSLNDQTCKETILYIIDNSPNEHTDALLEKYRGQYPAMEQRHIKSPSNIGVAAGNNIGIKAALADNCTHVLLLNNDIKIEQPHLISQMLKRAVEQKEAIVVTKILYYDSRLVWMAGGWIDMWRGLGVHYGIDMPDGPAWSESKYITYAPTCFMLIDAGVFTDTGFMDEKYFAYYDDTDFVFRALKQGHKMYYDASLCLLHKVSSSAGVNSPFYVYYSNRNKLYFIRKNFTGIHKWFAIFYTFLSRIAFWLKFDSTRKKKLVQALKDGMKL